MPSERSRYLKRSPNAPLHWNELKEHLLRLGENRLADIILDRSHGDSVLAKVVMVAAGIHSANGNWEKAKTAIDYALHFPDYVRYTEHGHEQVLDEIKISLALLVKQSQTAFALRIGLYAIERAQEIAENFEEDFEWTSTLEDLEKWLQEI